MQESFGEVSFHFRAFSSTGSNQKWHEMFLFFFFSWRLRQFEVNFWPHTVLVIYWNNLVVLLCLLLFPGGAPVLLFPRNYHSPFFFFFRLNTAPLSLFRTNSDSALHTSVMNPPTGDPFTTGGPTLTPQSTRRTGETQSSPQQQAATRQKLGHTVLR